MHIRKRRGGALLLLASMLLALTAGVSAADAEPAEDTLETRVAQFMEENYLNEQNFSMSYYNTVTGESYAFEDTHMMVAASTYKLPLNLYYYQQELAGEIAPDALIAGVYSRTTRSPKLCSTRSAAFRSTSGQCAHLRT